MMKKCPKCGSTHIVHVPSLTRCEGDIQAEVYVCMDCRYVELYANENLMDTARWEEEHR